jgi:hypothetical protein
MCYNRYLSRISRNMATMRRCWGWGVWGCNLGYHGTRRKKKDSRLNSRNPLLLLGCCSCSLMKINTFIFPHRISFNTAINCQCIRISQSVRINTCENFKILYICEVCFVYTDWRYLVFAQCVNDVSTTN